eukprot:403354780
MGDKLLNQSNLPNLQNIQNKTLNGFNKMQGNNAIQNNQTQNQQNQQILANSWFQTTNLNQLNKFQKQVLFENIFVSDHKRKSLEMIQKDQSIGNAANKAQQQNAARLDLIKKKEQFNKIMNNMQNNATGASLHAYYHQNFGSGLGSSLIQQQQPQQNLFSQTSKPGQLFQPSQIKNVPLKGKSNSMNSKQTQDTNLVFEQQNSFFRYNQNQQPTQVPSISNQIQSQNIVNASSYFQYGENTQKFQSREFNVNNNQQTGQSSQQQQILQGLDVLQSNTLSRQRFKNVETLKNQSDPTPMRYTPNSYQPQKDLNQRLQNNLTGGTQLKTLLIAVILKQLEQMLVVNNSK